jgi:hypothetical protein
MRRLAEARSNSSACVLSLPTPVGFPNEWEALLRRVIGLRQANLKIAELGCCPSNAQATFVRQFECSIAEPHFPAQEIATL